MHEVTVQKQIRFNPSPKGSEPFIVNVGSENGFITVTLFILKSGAKSGGYHQDMHFYNY
jgi:hypothetical protein